MHVDGIDPVLRMSQKSHDSRDFDFPTLLGIRSSDLFGGESHRAR